MVFVRCSRQYTNRNICTNQPRLVLFVSLHHFVSVSLCDQWILRRLITFRYVADGQKSTCPATGIQYLPKSGSPAPPPSSSAAASSSAAGSTSAPSTTLTSVTKTTSSISASGSPGTLSGSGYLNGFTSGTQTGCLISGGTWFVGGTCATHTATASGKYDQQNLWLFTNMI